jgi:hypothetical protein
LQKVPDPVPDTILNICSFTMPTIINNFLLLLKALLFQKMLNPENVKNNAL